MITPYEDALEYMVRCPACGALMSPATTTLSWWDCINPNCLSDKQPGDIKTWRYGGRP